jgi:hypothetical protein
MSLTAYAVRRTAGALVVVLIVIAATQYAVWQMEPRALRGAALVLGGSPVERRAAELWTYFPLFALAVLGAGCAIVAVRLLRVPRPAGRASPAPTPSTRRMTP